MNRSFRPRMTFGLALAAMAPALGASSALAQDGDYTLLLRGDTRVVELDEGRFEATSDTGEPSVLFEGRRVHIAFCKTDSQLAPEGSLSFGIAALEDGDARARDFTVDFDAEPAPAYFDGRLLTAKDLDRDQRYRPSCEGAVSCRYTLSGGGRVIVFDGRTDAAPFVLDDLPEAFVAEPVHTADGHRGEIEITSWSFGGTTATLDTGERFAVETVSVRSHELGHLLTVSHTTVGARGTDTLTVEVDSDGVLAAIETLVHAPDSGVFDVRGDMRVELAATSTATRATARFAATPGLEQRVRIRLSGTSEWGSFTPWSLDRVDRRLPVPAPGLEHTFDYELEQRTTGATPTIGGHGYIKIKKLNSGG